MPYATSVCQKPREKAWGNASPLLLGGTAGTFEREQSAESSHFSARIGAKDTATLLGISDWMRPRAQVESDSLTISREKALKEALKSIEDLYRLPEASAVRVRAFISANPYLADLLLEAHPHIEKHFGPNPQLALEVIVDPEEEDFEELFAYILTTLEPEVALARLDQFDEAWFLDQLARAAGKLNFNLEFV